MADQLDPSQVAEFREAYNLYSREIDLNLPCDKLGDCIRSLYFNITNEEGTLYILLFSMSYIFAC